jgi:hypothetical protein
MQYNKNRVKQIEKGKPYENLGRKIDRSKDKQFSKTAGLPIEVNL